MASVDSLVIELLKAINLPALMTTVAMLFRSLLTPVVLAASADNVVTLSSSATPALCAVIISVGENADVKALATDLVLV
jgi:hypothetical protein